MSHALLSASGAHRWLSCTPSAKLEELFPDSTSVYAEEGTLAHELCEIKVNKALLGMNTKSYNSKLKKIKANELYQVEMDKYTEEYLEYIQEKVHSFDYPPSIIVEKRVDFSSYVPEGFGTADCILLGDGELHIIDFKYGKGVPVSAEENPQMMLYALGAYRAYCFLYPIRNIHLAIVQPRLDSISEWSCSLDELLKFGIYVTERASLAIKGEGDFCPGEKQCRFCRAKQQCRARADHNVRMAFSSDKGKLPPLITAAEAGEYLTRGEDLEKWLNDLKEWALAECLAGKSVPGWKAVEGRGSRDWTDMDAAFDRLTKAGVTEEAMLWEKKPLTLAQVEKLVGKKDFQDAVGEFVIKRPGKPALVKESDKREAITNRVTAAEAFKEDK